MNAFPRRTKGPPRRTTAGLVAVIAAALMSGPASASSDPRVGQDLPVTATDLLRKPANNSPLLLASPTDSRLMLLANRLDGPDFSCALQASGDGGIHWVPAVPVRELPAGAEKCYAPEMAFDRHGKLYYLYVGLAGGGNHPVGAFLTTSDNGGRTFGPPRQVLGADSYGVRMAIDSSAGEGGRMHLAWLQGRPDEPTGGFAASPHPVMAAHSDDGGQTFSGPVQVNDTDRTRVVAPALALGRDHRVHVAYYDLGNDVRDYEGLDGPTWADPWSLVLSTSTDGGAHFGKGSVVDDAIVPPDRVMLIYTMPPASLAVDPSGPVYAGWHDARNHDWDAFVRRSSDGGANWDPPRRVNDDPMSNGHHQYLPRLGVAPNGRLDVIFYDRRLDTSNRVTNAYFTYSDDGGKTFAHNLRLSRVGFDSEIGPLYGVVSAQGRHEFGGRLAVVSRDSRAVVAWTDTRNTYPGPPAQDIFATSIDFAAGSGSGLFGVLLTVAVGAALLVVVVVIVWRSRRRPAGTETLDLETE